MFGLNDNRQAQEEPQGAASASATVDEAQAEDVLAAAAAAPHPSPAPENGVSPSPAPVAPPVASTPVAPVAPPPEPASDPAVEPAASPVPDQLTAAQPPATSGINGVSLENAYITTIPPHINSQPGNGSAVPTASSLVTDVHHDELVRLKQDALKKLEPLVDQLDQSPEEKFKTTMMLIQASDNAELVKEAFESANQIKDEKARAQALLDVVNEINYFTQHGSENS